jgi:hypothetical protein
MPKAKVGIGTADRVLNLIAAQKRVIRPRDFLDYQVPHTWLHLFDYYLELRKLGRGLYVLESDRAPVDYAVLMARKYRGLTLGLTSALWLQGVLPDPPTNDWWVLARRDRLPSMRLPSMRFVRSSWPREDRELRLLDGTPIHCQSVARALLDCVRFRRRLGEGVAEAALSRALESGAVDVEALMRRAEELRVRAPLRHMLRRLTSARELNATPQTTAAAH